MVHLAELADRGVELQDRDLGPEESALDADTQRCIKEVVAALPPLYRDAYVLSDIDALPTLEVAARLGITENLDREFRASDS